MTISPLISSQIAIALIDDDLLFLEALTALLKENYPLKTFNNPQNALDFFSLLAPSCSPTKKTEEIAVIIVDYNMPAMNGIDVCQKLKPLATKKILLTGESNNALATQALHTNVIDCFIRKDSLSLPEEIHRNLQLLIQEYLKSRVPATCNQPYPTDYF